MFSNKLKELRKSKHGLTQEMVAKQIGIAKTTYSAYEQGKRQPDFDILKKLAKYFNVTTDYLIDNDVPDWATKKDVHDLQKFLEDNSDSMTYGGDSLTEEEQEKLKIAMTQIFWKRHKHD